MEVEKLFCKFCKSETENEDQICNYCKAFDWKEDEVKRREAKLEAEFGRFTTLIEELGIFNRPLTRDETLILYGHIYYYQSQDKKRWGFSLWSTGIKKIIKKPDWSNTELDSNITVFRQQRVIMKIMAHDENSIYRLNYHHDEVLKLLESYDFRVLSNSTFLSELLDISSSRSTKEIR